MKNKWGKLGLNVICIGLLLGSLAACAEKENSGDMPSPVPVTPTELPNVTEPSPAPGMLEFESWEGVTVKSHGSLEAEAKIMGDGVRVVYTEDGFVLSFDGTDGYLELPKDTFAAITDGFTVAYRFRATDGKTATANRSQDMFNP